MKLSRTLSVLILLVLAVASVQCSSKGSDDGKKSKAEKKDSSSEDDSEEGNDDDNKVLIYSISKKIYFVTGREEPMFEIQVARLSTVDHSRRKHGEDRGEDEEEEEELGEVKKKASGSKEKGGRTKKETKSKRKRKDGGEDEDIRPGKAKVSINEASVKDICKVLEKINPLLLPISPLDFFASGDMPYKKKT